MSKRYTCIIFDPVLDTRMRLKQVTASVVDFQTSHMANSTDEALRILKGTALIDVVFVTGRLEREAFQTFVAEAKQTKQGEDAAYVLVMKGATESGADLAATMMAGADGILCEPYSVDQLVEITRLASRVRKERTDARQKVALGLIIDDVMTQLDLVAFLRGCGCEPGMSIKALRDLTQRIREIPEEYHQAYFELVCSKFENAPPPKKAFQTKVYAGASSRVRHQMERKIMAELSGRKKA